jgi:hypothetical protein
MVLTGLTAGLQMDMVLHKSIIRNDGVYNVLGITADLNVR